MSMHHITGDLLKSDCDYICHQVNCRGKMNSGVAKSIREKWPTVYNNYMIKYNDVIAAADHPSNMLGDIQIVALFDNFYTADNKQYVINMFAQDGYGYDGRRYTSYDAFWLCLGQICSIVPKGSSIAFPGFIGCVRGGANWDVIYEMINQVLAEDYEVYIYFLEATNE